MDETSKPKVHIPVPMPSETASLQEILAWINDAPTPVIRKIRKRQMHLRIYAASPTSFHNVLPKILGD